MDDDETLRGGELAAAISNLVVKIMANYIGRGPTKAKTMIGQDVIVVLMQESLTRAELMLLRSGQADFVLDTRRRYQSTMTADLISAVERLTNRKVLAFMSSNHTEPDMACEVFVLEPVEFGEEEAEIHPDQI